MGDDRRPWRGVDAETRTATRRRQLIDAAVAQVDAEGMAATSVRAVCKRANLTSRYFYESFDDLDALLVATFDELAHTVLDEMLAAVAAAPPKPRARATAALAVAAATAKRQPEILKVLVIESANNQALIERRLAWMHQIGDLLEEQATEIFGPPARGDELTRRVGARFLVGGLVEVLSAWAEGDVDATVDELAEIAMELGLGVARATRPSD